MLVLLAGSPRTTYLSGLAVTLARYGEVRQRLRSESFSDLYSVVSTLPSLTAVVSYWTCAAI